MNFVILLALLPSVVLQVTAVPAFAVRSTPERFEGKVIRVCGKLGYTSDGPYIASRHEEYDVWGGVVLKGLREEIKPGTETCIEGTVLDTFDKTTEYRLPRSVTTAVLEPHYILRIVDAGER